MTQVNPMTPAELAEIAARAEAAREVHLDDDKSPGRRWALIDISLGDIPRLLAEVERLAAENARLRTPNMFWVEHTEEMCNENAEDCAVEHAEQMESDGDELPTLVTLLCAHSLPKQTYAISRDEKGRVQAAQSLTTPEEGKT